MKLATLALLWAAIASGQALSFSPQGGDKLTLWAVSGCPARAVPSAALWALAIKHGVTPITNATAAEILSQRSPWARAVRAAGWVSAGGAALTGFDIIKTKPQVVTAFAVGGALILALLPLAQREVPQVDSAAGRSLMVDVDGCGVASFYALPSNMAAFRDEVPR